MLFHALTVAFAVFYQFFLLSGKEKADGIAIVLQVDTDIVAAMMAFQWLYHIFSQGCMEIVRASSADMLATWLMGVAIIVNYHDPIHHGRVIFPALIFDNSVSRWIDGFRHGALVASAMIFSILSDISFLIELGQI